jgi:hypothetical protein
MRYIPADWYWIVGDDRTKVWSSGRAGWVDVADPAYAAWLALGNGPTPIGSLDELAAVLAADYPAGMLAVYANVRQWALATGGHVVTVNGAAIPFATSVESMALMGGKVQRLGLPGAPATVNWQTGPTTFAAIPAADFITAATAVADFVQATFDKLSDILVGISGGAILTTADIDAAFAAM